MSEKTANSLRLAVSSYRALFKWSLRKAAKEIGVDHTALHRFESGEQVEAKVITKILVWLLK